MNNTIKIVLVFFLIIINAVYYCSRKENFSIDEIFSYYTMQTENTNFFNTKGESENRKVWHDRDYIIKHVTVAKDKSFDIKGIMQSERIRTDVHPPLYYLLFHIFSSTISPRQFTKWPGLILNLFFFILTLFVIINIFYLLTKSRLYSILCCLIYGLSLGAISTVVLVRMYMMLTFATLLFVYIHLLIYDKLKCKKERFFPDMAILYILLVMSVVLGVLTQYYFIVFMCIYCLSYIILTFSSGRKYIIHYICSIIIGCILCFLIYPDIYQHIFFSQRGEEAFDNFFSIQSYISSIYQFFRKINKGFFLTFGGYILLILLFTYFRKGKLSRLRENKSLSENNSKNCRD